MKKQIQNTFKPYHIGNGWGEFVDIEIYGDDINRQKLIPIIESYDDEYDAVDYYNDVKKGDIKKKDIKKDYVEKKDDIEELFKKIEKKIQEKDEAAFNFEKINKDVLNFVVNLDIITFVTITFVTVAGFCIP
jgi:transcription initiation factor IIF auxiliary subunit